MRQSRVTGIPPVGNEEIVKYVKRFSPVTTSQIKRALGSRSKCLTKQVGECSRIECIGLNAAREKIWRYIEDPT